MCVVSLFLRQENLFFLYKLTISSSNHNCPSGGLNLSKHETVPFGVPSLLPDATSFKNAKNLILIDCMTEINYGSEQPDVPALTVMIHFPTRSGMTERASKVSSVVRVNE